MASLLRLAAGCLAWRTGRPAGSSISAVQRAMRAPWAPAAGGAGTAVLGGARPVHWLLQRRSLTACATQEARGGGRLSPEELSAAEMDLQLPTHCSGCGVTLQSEEPEAPGFFQVPKRLLEALAADGLGGAGAGEEGEDDELLAFEEDDSELVFDDVGPEAYKDAGDAGEEGEGGGGGEASTSGRGPEYEQAKWGAFDAMVESWLGGSSQPRASVASYAEQEEEGAAGTAVLCARCFSLRNYGQVKNAAAEGDLPEFDFGRKVGAKIQLQKFRRSVVLCVVDVADFDGSLPRGAIRSMLPDDLREGGRLDVSDARLPLGFRLIIAVNKADLLPKKVTPARLERWVRKRMAQGGLPRPSTVHIVSSIKGRGVRELLADLQAAVGVRGDVWVVGAQNAGKSSLINSMRAAAGLGRDKDVTTAPLPGTTLGMLRVPGLLPTGCKMLDTPGVPHAFQLGAHLTADEMRMVLPRRPLKPRTFRIGAGQSVMIGGLARIDVVESPGATLYLSVFASDEIGCHMGKAATADERYAMHAGGKLAPPVGGPERMASFPALVPTDVAVAGDSWKASSTDVAIAGLGWVGVGVTGAASLRVWAPPGVAVTTHDALVPDFSKELERPGFGAALTDTGKGRREEEAKAYKAEKAAAAKAKRAANPPKGGRRAQQAASGGEQA